MYETRNFRLGGCDPRAGGEAKGASLCKGFFFARAFFLGKCLRCLLHASAQPPTPPDPYGPRSGRRLGPAASARSSTRSSSGADCRLAWGGAGQADPRAVHACDGLLHRHCQHGPPTPGPRGRRGAAHGWRSSLGTDTDEVPEQLVCTGIPPPTDLAPEHPPGRRLASGAQRPARRLRRVQRRRVAAGLCVTAATQVRHRSIYRAPPRGVAP